MILDRSMWDLIDILWIYIVDMLDDLKDSDHAQLQFPDQPLTLSCERIGRRMLQVSSHLAQLRRSAVVSEWNFVAEVKAAGLLFFCVADRLQGGYTDPIRRPERYQPKY